MQDGTYSASRARLDNKYKIPWKAGKLDKNQYIQVRIRSYVKSACNTMNAMQCSSVVLPRLETFMSEGNK